ncbi:bifunctional protein Rib2p [[Candida] anglica]|uniref:Bifunctional protein Rib2p n=1 Tax=[Candida] anglica TaxID=148631 RepID=A0ABP0EH78_9ASCO
MKRTASPLPNPTKGNKIRDSLGFRIRNQTLEKANRTAFDVLGETQAEDLSRTKTINEEEAEGASYVIDGPLRRVNAYYFTYLTYCKLRWRDRKLVDLFTEEFRDRDADFYRKTIAEGQIMLNRKPGNLESVVRNGDLISHRCHRHEPPVSSRPIKIVHEDDKIIAIDKPSGIPVHPTGRYRYNTITKVFQHEFGMVVHPCNRLDRLTSGLMFLGKSAKGTDEFVQQIRDRTVKKEYLARCVGKFPLGEEKPVSESGESVSDGIKILVDKPLRTVAPKVGLNRVDEVNGKEAATEFQRVSYDPETNTSIVKCRPLTGRTHQIRVHLQYLGHPIANDPIYSSEYVWGPELGKNGAGDDVEIEAKLDSVGKTRSASTWIHKEADGEALAENQCEICGTDLYTDPGPNDLDLWLHAYKYEAADLSWSYRTEYPEWAIEPHRKYMEMALEEANKCGETTTQYNVGAVLVNNGEVLSTGHSRELEGNTHAEQCALNKYFEKTGTTNVPRGTEIYTTMEPCTLRLSGNLPCTERILSSNITTCFVGVVEPDTFVQNNSSKSKLEKEGIEYIHIKGYEEKCLEIARKGHENIKKE